MGLDEYPCLRDDPQNKGVCPIADCAPELLPSNQLAVDLYFQAQGCAEIVVGKSKTYSYFKPSEVESLMRMRDIKPVEWDDILKRIVHLQDIHNSVRPSRAVPTRRRR